ncbi:MAG TPA: sigma-54 dependent transcriptional regulator [Ktedonobacteraceae bacterium]|nr:sigma-54 dependent transcriptional regulator [Ktedonobacteraceae bacterium]
MISTADVAVDEVFARVGLVVGRSPAMREVVAMVRQVASRPAATVLLQGESGTGKDVIARAIHDLGSRAPYQFVAINCAAVPETLFETELFGVEAGAFTDAKATRAGYLLRADGGTLFLDEIGAMSLNVQAKLLRFLESRSFRRVGGMKELHVNLRVIAATNADLRAAVAQKLFREDLFYRLQVITLTLPPLRERPEDIALLISHFLRVLHTDDMPSVQMSGEALQLLQRYSWPGNVRQLLGVIQRAQIVCDGQVIGARDLPEEVRKAESSALTRLREAQERLELPPEGMDLPVFLRAIERTFIQQALERCHGNQVQAAALLHLTRDQLRYRLSHQ